MQLLKRQLILYERSLNTDIGSQSVTVWLLVSEQHLKDLLKFP